jgi:hypothetical protein
MEAGKLHCEFEADPAKYVRNLPSLAAMVTDIKNLSATAKLNVVNFITKYRQSPYGQGPVAIALALACIRHHFGDGIRVKIDDNAIGEMPLRSFEEIVNLVEGRYPNAFISYRPLRDEEQQLSDEVFKVFGQAESAASAAQHASITQTYQAVQAWWQSLPPLARVVKLYQTGDNSYAVGFMSALEKIGGQDAYTFLFDSLPEVFGDGAGLLITAETIERVKEHLLAVKAAIESQVERVEERIFAEVRQIFGVQQHTLSDIVDTVVAWYNGLDSQQRDPFALWQDRDSKSLALHLKNLTDPRDTFLRAIPDSTDYGLKPVSDWMTDRVKEYTARLRSGKDLIDANRLKVESPQVTITGDFQQSGSRIDFKGEVKIDLKTRSKNAKIYVVEGNADPRDPNAQREEVLPGVPLQIHDHKEIHFVVQDAEGNWGRVETLALMNENKKFELSEPRQRALKDPMVQCVFPQDATTLVVTGRSLFKLALDRKVITLEQLDDIVQSILDDLKKAQ